MSYAHDIGSTPVDHLSYRLDTLSLRTYRPLMARGKSFGRALARARASARMTQTDLGRAIGRSQRTIARWEEGTTKTRPSDRDKLAHALAAVDARTGAWIREQWGLPPLPATGPSLADRKRELAWMIYAAADEADVSPKRLRAAIADVAARAAAAGISMDELNALVS
jgi:transcriptional regulator with XRE-family HTH domain